MSRLVEVESVILNLKLLLDVVVAVVAVAVVVVVVQRAQDSPQLPL